MIYFVFWGDIIQRVIFVGRSTFSVFFDYFDPEDGTDKVFRNVGQQM
jgi:hypothetical protein